MTILMWVGAWMLVGFCCYLILIGNTRKALGRYGIIVLVLSERSYNMSARKVIYHTKQYEWLLLYLCTLGGFFSLILAIVSHSKDFLRKQKQELLDIKAKINFVED